MIFLNLNHFLKLINDFQKKKNTQRAMWHDDVTWGSALLTSVVGPTDVSVDQVNVDR